jgi:hypothetical protein
MVGEIHRKLPFLSLPSEFEGSLKMLLRLFSEPLPQNDPKQQGFRGEETLMTVCPGTSLGLLRADGGAF